MPISLPISHEQPDESHSMAPIKSPQLPSDALHWWKSIFGWSLATALHSNHFRNQKKSRSIYPWFLLRRKCQIPSIPFPVL